MSDLPTTRRRRGGTAWGGGLAMLIGGWGALALLGAWLDGSPPRRPPDNRPIARTRGDYVSSNACRACHPGNYASWHASFHRTMTQVGVPAARRGELADLRLSRNGWDYAVARQGRAFFVRRKPAGAPVSAYGDPRQLVLTTGSHHLQIFWEETGTGRTLVQFPFAYIVATGTWAPVIQTFLAPPEFKSLYDVGEWNGACMQCHTTAPLGRFVGGDRFDSQVAEFGISCEACHGEGAEHIARNRNPLRRFALHLGGQADPTIVNPARLDAYASTLTCGQCHSISAFVDVSDKIAWTQFGRKYRPGQEELPQKFVLQPNTADHAAQKQAILRNNPHYFSDRFWPDGMVRVTGREMNAVLASPCFKGGHFSCVSCHEMHAPTAGDAALPTWADGHQLVAPDDSNAACLQCHREIGAKLAAHTHHAAGSTGSSCYNCHMPHTAFGLLRAIRSHQVSSPSVQETLQQGRPNACNLCHLDKPLGWTAEKLAAWYGRPAPALSDDDRRIAAGVRWLLQGNAGVRALTSWSMGWQPAQQASGRDWLYPYLFTGLNDPYAVVRFIAWRSLRTLPGYGDFPFDYTQEGAHLDAAVHAGYGEWRQRVVAPATFPASTGLAPDGGFEEDIFRRLLHQRDQSPVFIVE